MHLGLWITYFYSIARCPSEKHEVGKADTDVVCDHGSPLPSPPGRPPRRVAGVQGYAALACTPSARVGSLQVVKDYSLATLAAFLLDTPPLPGNLKNREKVRPFALPASSTMHNRPRRLLRGSQRA